MAKSKNKKISIPVMTIEEASEFWDEHSLFEFEGTEEVEVEFKLRKKQYIGIPLELFKRLEAKAKKMKISPEALLETWITEKMDVETSKS
jgi:hypothetical protein